MTGPRPPSLPSGACGADRRMDSPDSKENSESKQDPAVSNAEVANDAPATGYRDNGGFRISWLIGTDLDQARKRIRWGGGAGLAAAIINFIVIMSTYFVGDTGVEGVVQPSSGEFLFVLVEAVVVAGLAAGVLRRGRAAAAALLAYQVVSKLLLFGLAAFGLGPGNLNPVGLVLNLVFAYLFFQGLRGVLTWHYLTHPEYPAMSSGDTQETPKVSDID